MTRLFGDFDFQLLDDPEFREDSVREVLVAPLLAALGFTASAPYRIVKAGLSEDSDGKKYFHILSPVTIISASKIEDDLYSISGTFRQNDDKFAVTFDFGPEQYRKFLAELSPELREEVRTALSRQPYRFVFDPSTWPSMTIAGDLGDKTFTNENESYRAFLADEFIRDPEGMPL